MASNFYSFQSSSPQTLPELIARIWKEKKYLLAGIVMGLIAALILIIGLKPQYEASMIVAPPTHDSRTDSFVEGVFVYAPEVEAKIPTGSPDFIRFEQSLRGASVARLLFKMDGISKKIGEDTIWRGTETEIETPEELALYLSNHVHVETLGPTASRKITYRHPDPAFAVKLLTMLRKVDDQIIRTSVKSETETKIEWLKEEFKKTINPDHRQALAQLLMTEERHRMLLSLETPYAVSVVEESSATPHPVVPDKSLILIGMLLAGTICGAGIALFKSTTL